MKTFFKRLIDSTPGEEVHMRDGSILIIESYDHQKKELLLWDPKDDSIHREVAWNVAKIADVSSVSITGYPCSFCPCEFLSPIFFHTAASIGFRRNPLLECPKTAVFPPLLASQASPTTPSARR